MLEDNKYLMITGDYCLEGTMTCSPLEANWLTMKCLRLTVNYLCEAYPIQPQGFHLVNVRNKTIFTWLN